MTNVYVGTSGWTYAGWRGPFYPEKLRQKDWLRFYASQFTTAEINASFYRTPTPEAVRSWAEQTPAGFLFAWKASKFITHWKRLTNPDNSVELLHERLALLGDKVGPVLFQLPPRFKANPQRLEDFLRVLPRGYRYVFEFREPSWYGEPILDILRAHDVALCLSDHHDAPSPWTVTASFVYVRGHGPGGRYRDHYPDETLAQWARDIGRWRRQKRDVFVYFDNDQKSAAPLDAARLLALLAPKRRRSSGAASSP